MSEKLKVLSPSEYEFNFGPVIFEGYAKGTFIEIDYDEERTADETGADGETAVMVNKGAEKATITVTLMQTSICNAQLTALMNAVTHSPGMVGAIHPIGFRDPNGLTVYAGANAWISKGPDPKFADTPQPRVWKIRVPALKGGEGGN